MSRTTLICLHKIFRVVCEEQVKVLIIYTLPRFPNTLPNLLGTLPKVRIAFNSTVSDGQHSQSTFGISMRHRRKFVIVATFDKAHFSFQNESPVEKLERDLHCVFNCEN